MKIHGSTVGILASTALVSGAYQPQPNTLHALYPDLVTMSAEGIPILGDYKLLPVPGFESGTTPLVVVTTFDNDIRQGSLTVDSLKSTSLILPYIDRLGDGKTPFSKVYQAFIGGTYGRVLDGYAPSILGRLATAGGYKLYPGIMDPNDEAYHLIPTNEFSDGNYYSNTDFSVVPNPAGVGGSIRPNVANTFFRTGESKYGVDFIKAMVNQPAIVASNKCQRNQYRFNETFTNIVQRTAGVSLGDAVSLLGVTGQFSGGRAYPTAGGFTAVSEFVMFNPEDCASAAANSRVY